MKNIFLLNILVFLMGCSWFKSHDEHDHDDDDSSHAESAEEHHAEGAHVHGVAFAKIVKDGDVLLVGLTIPIVDLGLTVEDGKDKVMAALRGKGILQSEASAKCVQQTGDLKLQGSEKDHKEVFVSKQFKCESWSGDFSIDPSKISTSLEKIQVESLVNGKQQAPYSLTKKKFKLKF